MIHVHAISSLLRFYLLQVFLKTGVIIKPDDEYLLSKLANRCKNHLVLNKQLKRLLIYFACKNKEIFIFLTKPKQHPVNETDLVLFTAVLIVFEECFWSSLRQLMTNLWMTCTNHKVNTSYFSVIFFLFFLSCDHNSSWPVWNIWRM